MCQEVLHELDLEMRNHIPIQMEKSGDGMEGRPNRRQTRCTDHQGTLTSPGVLYSQYH